uniref:ATP synthase F0 subunit 8 n=1 Tax=Acropyga pallida TaxID=602221 RepID=A0A6G5NIG5_9HYME|nr:ATP synthase F0 subunit 8 [Acropyga pallida]QBG38660.1 ATP synthase F0 subunit 8 [Acropyga pallida]
MPHMMPSMWILILMMNLISLYMIMSMLYFLNYPSYYPKKNLNLTPKKWMWKW